MLAPWHIRSEKSMDFANGCAKEPAQALDVPCFASYMLCRDISAFHWEHDHCAPAHHFHSGDTEP